MAWFRVDNRLLHGQIIEGWLPYLDATRLVVANDALAADELRQKIMMMTLSSRICGSFVSLAEAKAVFGALEAKSVRSLFLLANCQDVLWLVEQGVTVPVLNVGNLHYAEGKRQICPHVAVSKGDEDCLRRLRQHGVVLDFRRVPGDTLTVEEWQ